MGKEYYVKLPKFPEIIEPETANWRRGEWMKGNDDEHVIMEERGWE